METITPIVDTDLAPNLTEELTAQVIAALRQAVPPAAVRERFGLSVEDFRQIIRQQNQKVEALLDRWKIEDAACPDEKEVDIDELLRANPLSLREFSFE